MIVGIVRSAVPIETFDPANSIFRGLEALATGENTGITGFVIPVDRRIAFSFGSGKVTNPSHRKYLLASIAGKD
jgi:hypothetical protein